MKQLFFRLTLFALLLAFSVSVDCQPAPIDRTEQGAPQTPAYQSSKITAPAPASEKLDTATSDEIPENPFEPGLTKDEVAERAFAWFSKLKIFLTLAAGWLLKLIAKRFPNFKFGKFLPAAIFGLAFVGFGFGYGWDVPTLFSNAFSIVTALALHATVLNPVEGAIKGKPVESDAQKKE